MRPRDAGMEAQVGY